MPSLSAHYPIPPFVPQLTNDEFRQLKPDSVCPACRGQGSFLWDRDENGPAESPVEWRCACLDQLMLRNYMMRCGIGLHFQRRGVDELPVFQGMDLLVDYSAQCQEYGEVGMGLVIRGDSCVGKSTWAAVILKNFLRQGWDGQMVQFDVLVDKFVATWARKGGEERRQSDVDWFTRRIVNVPVLLIDNLGRVAQRADVGAVEQALVRVIGERIAATRPTILTLSGAPKGVPGWDGVFAGLHSTSIDCTVRGQSLAEANRARLLADVQAGIRRPVRLG